MADAFRKALATDPQTAFGSAVAANRVIDDEAAHERVIVDHRYVEMSTRQRVEAIVDIPAPPGTYVATVHAVYPD